MSRRGILVCWFFNDMKYFCEPCFYCLNDVKCLILVSNNSFSSFRDRLTKHVIYTILSVKKHVKYFNIGSIIFFIQVLSHDIIDECWRISHLLKNSTSWILKSNISHTCSTIYLQKCLFSRIEKEKE